MDSDTYGVYCQCTNISTYIHTIILKTYAYKWAIDCTVLFLSPNTKRQADGTCVPEAGLIRDCPDCQNCSGKSAIPVPVQPLHTENTV